MELAKGHLESAVVSSVTVGGFIRSPWISHGHHSGSLVVAHDGVDMVVDRERTLSRFPTRPVPITAVGTVSGNQTAFALASRYQASDIRRAAISANVMNDPLLAGKQLISLRGMPPIESVSAVGIVSHVARAASLVTGALQDISPIAIGVDSEISLCVGRGGRLRWAGDQPDLGSSPHTDRLSVAESFSQADQES